MKPLLKTAALLAACGVAAAALSSCGGDTSWTYRTEDGKYEVTSGMYVGMSISAYNEGFSQEGIDSSTALYDQQIGSVDALSWVTTRTDTIAKKYLAVESKFDEYGLTFSDDELSYINSYVDYYWSYVSTSYEPQGCGAESYRNILTNTFKESQLFYHIYGEGGEREVAEEDLRAIFDEQYAHTNIFQVDASDEEGEALTGHDLELKQGEVDAMIERIQGGEAFETVKTEATASDSTEDTEQAADTSVYLVEGMTSYPEDLITAIFAAETDEVSSYDDGEGTIYVWTRLSNDDNGFVSYRDTILQNEKWEEYTQYEQDWVNAMTFTTNDAAIKKHTPKNLEK